MKVDGLFANAVFGRAPLSRRWPFQVMANTVAGDCAKPASASIYLIVGEARSQHRQTADR